MDLTDATDPMPFDGHDVQRVVTRLDNRHSIVRKLFGLESIAGLLHSLWLAGEAKASEFATVTGAYEITRYELAEATKAHKVIKDELRYLKQRLQRSITFLIDEAIQRRKATSPFVVILSPNQFFALDGEYDCPDTLRASTKERWAYTYKKHRVYTMAGIIGPLLMDADAFAKLNAYRSDLSIREM